MDTKLKFLVLCFLFFIDISAIRSQQSTTEVKQGSLCAVHKTCGKCLAEGPSCGWCKQENYKHPERCDVVDNLVSNGCNKEHIVNPSSTINYAVNNPPRNAEGNREAIQLSPQIVNIKLRPKESLNFNVSFRLAENYPVDLYYLMDLSYTMRDDKAKLAEVTDLLASKMSSITKNFRLGFGSFVDKKTMPYVSTVPQFFERPCDICVAAYGFRNVVPLTVDTSVFRDEVTRAPISGNLDAPEGGLDAIMQSIVCTREIGWREQSRKMLLFSTDAGFHYAGDGKLGGIVTPNDGKCHLDNRGEYTASLDLDYPSIGHLAHKITETKVNVIFAITRDNLEVYRNLSKFIEGSTVGQLDSDSSNIVDLVKENYDKISSSIELKTEDDEDVMVRFKTKCLGNQERDIAKCENIGIGQSVSFEVSVMVTSCPADRSQWKKTFKIYPVGLAETLTVNLELQCECDCEKPELEEKNSPKCNSSGTYECGACTCNEGRYGRQCECDRSTMSSADYDNTCKRTNTSKVCEGRGQCLCGNCECQAVISTNTSMRYSGPFCECNDYNCYYSHGQVCGGPERGVCRCSRCNCIEGMYEGDACECPVSQDSCRSNDGSICNNKGTCECGKCTCEQEYRGQTCEECSTCPGACEQKQSCVQCRAYKTSNEISEESCKDNCGHVEIVEELGGNANPESWTTCRFRDKDNCDATFEYHHDSKRVKALKQKVCPQTVVAWHIALYVIAAIIVIGLVILLLWKLFVTIQDRREYARFEKERENARWEQGENPLFKQATTTFNNPAFAVNSSTAE